MPVKTILQLAFKAGKFDKDFFTGLQNEKQALAFAFIVLGTASLGTGIGSMGKIGVPGIVAGTVGAAVKWIFTVYIIYLIGMKSGDRTSYDKNFYRTLKYFGFAAAPGVIRVFGLLPGFYKPVFFIGTMWMLGIAAFVIDHIFEIGDIIKSAGICIISWLITLAAVKLITFSLSAVDPFF